MSYKVGDIIECVGIPKVGPGSLTLGKHYTILRIWGSGSFELDNHMVFMGHEYALYFKQTGANLNVMLHNLDESIKAHTNKASESEARCTCGGESVGATAHPDYCDVNIKTIDDTEIPGELFF